MSAQLRSVKGLAVLQWLPLAFLFWLAAGHYVEQPILDQWPLSVFIGKVMAGTVTLGDLFAYHHVVHLHVVPRLIHTSIALASNWTIKAEVLFNLCFVGATFALLLAVSRLRVAKSGRAGLAVPNLLMAFALFSPVQHFNWFYAFALNIFLVNAAVVACAWLLCRGDEITRRDFWLAALCCGLATLSRMDGLATWLCAIPCLVQRLPSSARRWEFAVLWAILSLGCWLAVLGGIDSAALGDSTPTAVLGRPLAASAHFFAIIGAPLASFVHPLFPSLPVGAAWSPVGVVMTALFGYFVWACMWGPAAGIRDRAIPWISMGIFPFVYAALNTVGRIEKADSLFYIGTMYSGSTVLLVVALVQLGALTFGVFTRGRAVAATALVVLLVSNYAFEIPRLVEQRRNSPTRSVCVDLVTYFEANNNCLYASRAGLERLERLGFRTPVRDVEFAAVSSETRGGINWVSRERRSARHAEQFLIRGWVDGVGLSFPPHVLLSREGIGSFVAYAGEVSRSDGEGRIRWSAAIPADYLGRSRTLQAWLYEPDARRFTPLGAPAPL